MKTKFPSGYGPGMTVKVPPETITSELSQASKKASARYPSPVQPVNRSGGGTGPMKHRALTPGTSPTGS